MRDEISARSLVRLWLGAKFVKTKKRGYIVGVQNSDADAGTTQCYNAEGIRGISPEFLGNHAGHLAVRKEGGGNPDINTGIKRSREILDGVTSPLTRTSGQPFSNIFDDRCRWQVLHTREAVSPDRESLPIYPMNPCTFGSSPAYYMGPTTVIATRQMRRLVPLVTELAPTVGKIHFQAALAVRHVRLHLACLKRQTYPAKLSSSLCAAILTSARLRRSSRKYFEIAMRMRTPRQRQILVPPAFEVARNALRAASPQTPTGATCHSLSVDELQPEKTTHPTKARPIHPSPSFTSSWHDSPHSGVRAVGFGSHPSTAIGSFGLESDNTATAAAFGTRRSSLESDNTNPILELAFGTRFGYGSVGGGKQHRRPGLRLSFAARVSVDDEYVRYGKFVRPAEHWRCLTMRASGYGVARGGKFEAAAGRGRGP
ncbi:hypothetical protein K438DRAFT_1773952 [Mycena galopus ATCC 62051]|nr:hypothetical protein K438DRAFT_1773952 [Mycena galopus ATCC 62051]